MENVSNLTELKARLEAETSGGNLTLTPANSADDGLKAFLESVPERGVSLSSTTFTLDETASVLTVSGDAAAQWVIRSTAERIRLTRVTLIYTESPGGFAAQFKAEGTVRVGGRDVALSGELGEKSRVSFALKPAAPSSIALTEAADFVSGGKLGPYLPVGIDIFGTVPLSALDVTFGFRRTADSSLSFTSDVAGAEWTIIEDLAALKSIGVTLVRQFLFREGGEPREVVGGDIHGVLNIGQDFAVRLALQGQDYWEVEVIPADGNILPGLETLAGLAGGESLQASVSDGLESLGFGAFAIDDVRIAFDINTSRLRRIGMAGHVTVEGLTFAVRASLPVFEFFGGLSPSTPIDLRALVAKFFDGADSFPEIDVTRLDLSAQTGIGRYSLDTTIVSDWVMTVGAVALGFKEFAFEIVKQTAGITGYIEGKLTLAGVLLEVLASHEEVGAGWQFTCTSEGGKELPIGELIAGIAADFGVDETLPGPVKDLTVKNLYVFFDTQTQNFVFQCESQFPIEQKQVSIRVDIELTKNGARYDKRIGGNILIGDLAFDLKFVQNAASDFFVATYHPVTPGLTQDVKQLIQTLSDEVAGYVPEGLTVELKDIIFGYGATAQTGTQDGGTQTAAASKFIVGLDIGTGINLSNLPLVGQEFPKDATVGVDDLQILFISQGLTASDVSSFNSLIPTGVTKLPVPAPPTQQGGDPSGTTTTTATVVLQQGFNVSAQMKFGGSTQVLSLPASGSTTTTTTTTTTTPPPANSNVSTNDSAKWFVLQKSFGPVYFEKVGVHYQDKTIWFLLSATLTAAGLSLSLDGLGLGGSLDKYMPPSFDLRGIGVGYQSGPVEVTGAFLRQRVTQGDVTYDEYDGAALIRTEQLSLSAIGSYAYMDGHPSMFIYAVLDYPIGGPSFFFITGLAAGFGYNRALVPPAIEQVAQFPLVAEAVSGAGMPASLSAELQKLRQYIPPEVGEFFLAVGIKFTSFKLVDSFALLTVSFGRRFEIDLLGLSTLIVPTPIPGQSVTPLAEVQMALRASYVPDEGFLGVSAQLTSASFILSRDCHLTGGFAFWSWLAGEHEGDFILTLGGYHPNYKVPAHYPKVPRLGFNWRVNSNLSIKGDIYYALTASTLMAGGSLQATWEDGSIKAWFKAGANFIIGWKPYHYDATMYVDVGVSYTYHFFGTHHLNVNVGADLHLWGPEFSGKAHIKLSVVSFDIKFGSNSSQTAKPIDWPTFKKSFLPADSQVCSLAVKDGLAKDSPDGWVVNPKQFTLVSNSVIPATEAYAGAAAISGAGGGAQLGLAPMAVGSYVARHTIRITKGGVSYEDRFEFVPVRKKMPAAMWGRSFSPSLNGAAFVENALAGFEIKPKAKPQAGATAAIDPGVLQYSSESVPDAYTWETFAEFAPAAGTDADRTQAIKDSLANPTAAAARSQLLDDFKLQATVNVTAAAAGDFLDAPQTGTLAA